MQKRLGPQWRQPARRRDASVMVLPWTSPTFCVVWVSEQWASQADLDAHLKTPHVAAFLEACAALEILDMEVRRYEVSSVGDLVMPE